MKSTPALYAFLLGALVLSANAKPEGWRPPLLTLGQISERLVAGQTPQEITDFIPFKVEALRMPRSGPLKEYTVLLVPKGDIATEITEGIYCRFEDDTEILLKTETKKEPNQRLQTMRFKPHECDSTGSACLTRNVRQKK